MSLGSNYRELIQRKLIIDFLRQGVIPGRRLLQSLLDEAISSNPNLDQPFTSENQFSLELGEDSSASKFNSTVENLTIDLQALYRTIVENGRKATSITSKALSEFKSLEKEAISLDNLASNLLLVANDVEGFVDFVHDDFSNNNKISLSDSTVFLDNKTQTVELPPATNNKIATNFDNSNLQFNVISRSGLVSNSNAVDSDLLNMFSDQEKYWLQTVGYSTPPAEFISEVIISFPKVPIVSRSILRPVSPDKGSILSVILQYSSDGINWFDVENGNRRIVGDTTFSFEKIEASYWKFIFYKTGYDNFVGDTYFFDLAIKSIEFFGLEYKLDSQQQKQAVFYSLPQTPANGTAFNKASIKVCENLPKKTSIDYQLAFMSSAEYDSFQSGALALSDLKYSDLDPINREEQNKPLVIDGAQISRLQNFNSSYVLDSDTGHKYISNVNNILIDTYTLDSNVTNDSIQVFRNIGDNTVDGGSNNPVLVNNVDSGWILDGDFYFCNFFIEEPEGRVIDFGADFVEIDGVKTSGRINLIYGRHTIRTHRRNWVSIAPATISDPSDENPDPIYPYNHKYLIEGVGTTLYGVSLTADLGDGTTRKDIIDPNGVYSPVAKYWGRTLRQVSIFDFVSKIDDNDFTAYTIVEDVNGDKRVLVKYNPTSGLFDNERFAIIEDQITGNLFKYVVLRAFLRSTTPSSSPSIDSYVVRLGL